MKRATLTLDEYRTLHDHLVAVDKALNVYLPEGRLADRGHYREAAEGIREATRRLMVARTYLSTTKQLDGGVERE